MDFLWALGSHLSPLWKPIYFIYFNHQNNKPSRTSICELVSTRHFYISSHWNFMKIGCYQVGILHSLKVDFLASSPISAILVLWTDKLSLKLHLPSLSSYYIQVISSHKNIVQISEQHLASELSMKIYYFSVQDFLNTWSHGGTHVLPTTRRALPAIIQGALMQSIHFMLHRLLLAEPLAEDP